VRVKRREKFKVVKHFVATNLKGEEFDFVLKFFNVVK